MASHTSSKGNGDDGNDGGPNAANYESKRHSRVGKYLVFIARFVYSEVVAPL